MELSAFLFKGIVMDSKLTYTKKEAGMYLTGLFGQNLIYNVVSTGLYFYFQNVICLPAVALGWIFAIARIWDAVNDPMMGSIVDKTKSKWGKCKPYLLFSPIVICVITCLCFINGSYAEQKIAGNSTAMIFIVAWAAVSYILWGMCYTAGDVPLWGVISRMSEVQKDRASLIALARIVASVAAGLGVVTIVMFSQAANKALGESENAQKGFIVVGFAMTIVASFLFEFAGLGVKERVPNSVESKSMKESFALMWNCKPFRRLMISGILRAPLQLMTMVVMTLFSYYYCGGDLTNAFSDLKILITVVIIGGSFFIGQFGANALCPVLMKKLDVKTIYNATGICAIPLALLFVTYLIAPTELAKIGWVVIDGVLLLFAGAGFGAVYVCQSVMISDCIDYEEYHSNYRPDGVFFSGQSFIQKFSTGIASIISAYVYAAVGYSDINIEKMNQAIANGASFASDYTGYSKAMWFLLTIPPAIGMAIAVIPTLKYEITSKNHEQMLNELIERHSKIEK